MNEQVEGLLNQYESGRMSRRQFVAAMTALTAAPAVLSAPAPIGIAQQLNHVTVFVKDVQKSVRFYQELLGMTVLSEQNGGINLRAGAGFVGIYQGPPNSAGTINHFCLGVPNFDADVVLKELTARGLQANIRMRGETKELYFNDIDNVRVQLQDVKYKGGGGVLGDK